MTGDGNSQRSWKIQNNFHSSQIHGINHVSCEKKIGSILVRKEFNFICYWVHFSRPRDEARFQDVLRSFDIYAEHSLCFRLQRSVSRCTSRRSTLISFATNPLCSGHWSSWSWTLSKNLIWVTLVDADRGCGHSSSSWALFLPLHILRFALCSCAKIHSSTLRSPFRQLSTPW